MKKIPSYLKMVLFLIGASLFLALIKKAGARNILTSLETMSLPLLMAGIIVGISNLLVNAFRSKSLLRTNISYLTILKISLLSYLFNYASAIQGAGAATKVGLLKLEKIKVSRSSSTIFLEILFDLFVTGIIALIFLIFNNNLFFEHLLLLFYKRTLLIIFLVILLIMGICTLVILNYRRSIFFKLFFKHILHTLKFSKVLYYVAITLGLWALSAIYIKLLFKSTGFNIDFLSVLPILCMGYSLAFFTLVPGGLGVRDAIWAYGYFLTGIPMESAIVVTVFSRILSFVIVGASFLVTHLISKIFKPTKVLG